MQCITPIETKKGISETLVETFNNSKKVIFILINQRYDRVSFQEKY